MSNINEVKRFAGRRMDIRIVEFVNQPGTYWIQYQFSKKNDKWLNYIWSDYKKGSEANLNGGRFWDIKDAIPYAKRKLANNN